MILSSMASITTHHSSAHSYIFLREHTGHHPGKSKEPKVSTVAQASELCSCDKHCVRDAILKGSKEIFLIYLLANYALKGFEPFGENALSLLILSQKFI